MENAGFIFAAYSVIWALIFGYVLFLVRRQAAIKKRIDAITGRRGEDSERRP